MTDGVIRRLPLKGKDDRIDLIEIDGVFYLEASGHDTLIRIKRFQLIVNGMAITIY
jgi:hypothetical protein